MPRNSANGNGSEHTVGGVAGDRLKSFIDRIEALEEEIRDAKNGRADVFAEAKEAGFSPKIMRRVIRERRLTGETRAARLEEDDLFDLYWNALGLTPIEELAEQARAAQASEGEGAAA